MLNIEERPTGTMRIPSCNHGQRIFAKYCGFQPDIFSLSKVRILAGYV